MAYGNYAPFYRPGFFNPIQPMQMQNIQDNGNQFGQPYQQPMQQQMQVPQMQMPMQSQPNNDMIWVLNETEATSYPVAPNNTVTLWDKNSPTIYIKSVDANGVPSMRILDFSERVPNAPKTAQEHVCKCGGRYAPIDEFNALKQKFAALSQRVEELKANPIAKSKKVEVENDG